MSSPITILNRPPLAEILDSLSKAIREGAPPAVKSPPWTDPKTAAPAKHWLLEAGTRIYTYDEPEAIKSPAVLLSINGEATQKYPHSRAYWMVPVRVSVMMAHKYKMSQVDAKIADLTRLLVEDLPTGNPATQTPWGRLSNGVCHVFPYGIRDVKTSPLQNGAGGNPVLDLTATIFCATRTMLPSAG